MSETYWQRLARELHGFGCAEPVCSECVDDDARILEAHLAGIVNAAREVTYPFSADVRESKIRALRDALSKEDLLP